MKFKKLFLILSLCLLSVSCASNLSGNGSQYSSNPKDLPQGAPVELYKTGNRYAQGIGVPVDSKKAVLYYEAAASQG